MAIINTCTKSHPKFKDKNRTVRKSRGNKFRMLLNLFTRLINKGEDGYEQPQRKGCWHENRQGPGQVLGGRCDFRTSWVSHPPKSVIQTVIWRLCFVTCPGKNCDLPWVVLQKLWFAGQVSARKAWSGLWFELRNHNTWLETWLPYWKLCYIDLNYLWQIIFQIPFVHEGFFPRQNQIWGGGEKHWSLRHDMMCLCLFLTRGVIIS